MKEFEKSHPYFHPEGLPAIGVSILIMILLTFLGGAFFCLGTVLAVWTCYFFRDPRRITPTRPGLIVSPADGKVVSIQEVEPDEDLGLEKGPRTRISIFLNVFDVHVNRIPIEGTIKSRRYRKGKFFNASLDKASVDNERMSCVLELGGEHPWSGHTLGVVQIAGLVARRIVCAAQEGETFRTGERYGIIRFGSRVDVYLPPGAQPLVLIDQYMLGGETILADLASEEPARVGEQRE